MTDHLETKERIIRFLRVRGPSIPVYIAKEINQSILFTSAFLSELLSEKRVLISYLRVGSSPVYFLPGQEHRLENFSQYLKNKEKDAFLLLKEKIFLEDSKQEPAIRVALRAIKDFAVAFQKNNLLIWRYFAIPEEEFKENKIISSEPSIIAVQKEPLTIEINNQNTEEKNAKEQKPEEISVPKELNIFDDKKEKPAKKKKVAQKILPKKPVKKSRASEKKNEKFFSRVKEFLEKKPIEISGIEGFNKDELILKVKENGKERLLIAYNKKKITEEEIIRANKKASEERIEYSILSIGEPSKKLANFIDAVKNLKEIEKIE